MHDCLLRYDKFNKHPFFGDVLGNENNYMINFKAWKHFLKRNKMEKLWKSVLVSGKS